MFTEKVVQNAYRIATVLFLIFVANILVGKISMSLFDRQLPLGFGGTIEFLLMLAACIALVAGVLRSESQKKK
jgi:hypothetical protein